MMLELLNKMHHGKENVGIITNYFSKQFLTHQFDVFEIPINNFAEYININNIKTVVIDNIIYETDNDWYNKDIGGLLAYLRLLNIDVIFIKNTQESIKNTYLDYYIIDIELDFHQRPIDKSEKIIKLPVLLNEEMFNPINSIKRKDVLYLKQGEISKPSAIQKFHASSNPEKDELTYDEFSRDFLIKLINKIKESKCLYIYSANRMDPLILKYIELIALLQHTVVLYGEQENPSPFVLSNNILVNINYMTIMKQDSYYIDKKLIPIQRDIFLNNTFIFNNRISDIVESSKKRSSKVNVSVITSTNRKHNLSRYIEQLKNQNLVNIQLILVTHGFELSEEELKVFLDKGSNIEIDVIEVGQEFPLGYCLNTAIQNIEHEYVAKIDDDDYYYENYLIDSWISAKYSGADLVGKFSTYTFFSGSNLTISKHKNTRRKYHSFVMGATFFSKSDLMRKYMFSYLPTGEDSDFLKRIKEDKAVVYADHPYNFCIFRDQDLESHTWKISDIEFMKNSYIETYEDPVTILSL